MILDSHTYHDMFDSILTFSSCRLSLVVGGTREIQRTMLELLNQLDGFDERGDVKVNASALVLLFLVLLLCRGRCLFRFSTLMLLF